MKAEAEGRRTKAEAAAAGITIKEPAYGARSAFEPYR